MRILTFLLFLIPGVVFCQNSFPNTVVYSDSIASPKATLKDISWVAGHWKGEAFGGITEEIWSPPSGESMMCSFKLTVNGKVKFYELCIIREVNETLLLQIKHFNADLKGWEEKDKSVDFKLVKVTPDKIYFDGFTFERVNKREMNIYVVVSSKGVKMETKFNYKRAK